MPTMAERENKMTDIIINEKSTISAEGQLHSKACKPVICITTGKVYTSATDAAQANGVSVYAISCNCLGKTKTAAGKRFCYLKDVAQHLGHIVSLIEKAAAYDALKAEENAAREAEEQYKRDLEVAESKYTRRMAAFEKAREKLRIAEAKLIKADMELLAVKERGEQFAL